MVVGEDHLACVDVGRRQIELLKGCGDDDRREPFAVADDEVRGTRGELAEDGDTAHELIQGVKGAVDVFLQGASPGPPTSCAAVSRWRVRNRLAISNAASRSPRPAEAAAAQASSWSVTLLIAETTTTGERPLARRPVTIRAVREMAAASSTEVPPNFMTTSCWFAVLTRRPSQTRQKRAASCQRRS